MKTVTLRLILSNGFRLDFLLFLIVKRFLVYHSPNVEEIEGKMWSVDAFWSRVRQFVPRLGVLKIKNLMIIKNQYVAVTCVKIFFQILWNWVIDEFLFCRETSSEKCPVAELIKTHKSTPRCEHAPLLTP